MEFCSCSWQPATPEGNSSLRLPTREPCPCRVELDGAQTQQSPAWKQDRAVCVPLLSHTPRAQAMPGGLTATTQSCSQPLSLRCTKPAPKAPLLRNMFSIHWLHTTGGALMDHHHHRGTHGPTLSHLLVPPSQPWVP